jgi:hypothetical protein
LVGPLKSVNGDCRGVTVINVGVLEHPLQQELPS